MRVEPEAPFGEGTEPVVTKRPYWKKLAITLGIVFGLFAAVAALSFGGILAYRIGGRIGGHNAEVGGLIVYIVFLWCAAIASSDWDSEDGY